MDRATFHAVVSRTIQSWAGGLSPRLLAITLLAATGDGLLIGAGLFELAPLTILLALHAALLPLVWLGLKGSSPALAAMGLVSIAVLGPIGALGTCFVAAAAGKTDAGYAHANWHSKLARPVGRDLAQQLAQAIGEGRMIPPGSSAPTSFAETARRGSVAQRQTMLGLISQHFSPEFSPVLRRELTSEEAAVRVSAAAVFSKLRDRNRQLMGSGAQLPDILSPDEARERGMALARSVWSGLLDQADLIAIRARSLELLLLARPRATMADELEEVIATLLFEAGHHDILGERLDSIVLGRSQVLSDLRVRLLMKSGRTSEAADIIRRRREPSSLSLVGRGRHPLLSPRIGVVR